MIFLTKRKAYMFLLLAVLCTVVGCESGKMQHELSYIDGKFMSIPYNDTNMNCVAVFTQYTNSSGETVVPADNVDVKAYQHGKELTIWVFTGEKTEGYIQCDTSVQTGTTADVIWIFEREDDSEVSVEFSDGQTFSIK